MILFLLCLTFHPICVNTKYKNIHSIKQHILLRQEYKYTRVDQKHEIRQNAYLPYG